MAEYIKSGLEEMLKEAEKSYMKVRSKLDAVRQALA